MDKMLLTDSHQVFGHWYLPGDEDRALAGQLTYEPDAGLRLEVVSRLGGLATTSGARDGLRRHDLILGRTKTQAVSLYDCNRTSMTVTGKGEGATAYRPSLALFGGHDDGTEPFIARDVRTHIPVLDAWMPITGITDDGAPRRAQTSSYVPVEPLTIELPWGSIVVTAHSVSHLALPPRTREYRMKEWLELSILPKSGASIDKILLHYVQPLVQLASLLTSARARVEYLTVVEAGSSDSGDQSFDLLYRSTSFEGSSDQIDESKYLLPPWDVSPEDVITLVQRWYESRVRYERAMDMYFAMEHTPPGTYLEVRFLTLCHAAEALHRDAPVEQKRWPKKEYKRLRDAALKAVSDQPALEDVLSEQLHYANQLSLRDRLTKLRDITLGADSDTIPDPVIEKISKARNNLTHSSTKDLSRLENPDLLYYLTEYVRWLLRLSFLRELGIPESRFDHLLSRNPDFSWLGKAVANLLATSGNPSSAGQSDCQR